VKVDPSIIGGLVVKLGSRMVDSSLRTKLNSIKARDERGRLMDIRARGNFRDPQGTRSRISARRLRFPKVGQVLSVGDGIARVYGLDNVQSGEMSSSRTAPAGMALNLETDNVGIGFSAPTARSRKARPSSAPAPSSIPRRQGPARPGRRCARQSDRRQGPDPADKRMRVDVKAPGIIPRKSVNEPMATGSRRSMPDPDRPWPARI